VRVLVVTHRLPYPPDKGDRIRAYQWLNALARDHEVDVLALADEEVPLDHRRALEQCAHRVWTVTRRRSDLAGRMIRSILTGRSLTEAYFGSRRFSETLHRLLAEHEYDVCVAICSSVAAHVLHASSPPPLIVDLVDVDSVKWRRYGERHRGLRKWIYRRESETVARLERELAARADTIVTVSPAECELLQRIAPAARSRAIPNAVDGDFFRPFDAGGNIDHLVFVGQMDYFPNVDAVAWFAQQVWPALRQRRTDLKWMIVGRHPSRAVKRLGKLPNVTVTGTVADVRPYLRSAISIAPLRVACGVQNKVLEALSCGRPVVASSEVVRGLSLHAQKEILLADEPAEWIAAIELLLDDPALARRLGENARRAVRNRFDGHQAADRMRRCVSRHGAGRRDPERSTEATQPVCAG